MSNRCTRGSAGTDDAAVLVVVGLFLLYSVTGLLIHSVVFAAIVVGWLTPPNSAAAMNDSDMEVSSTPPTCRCRGRWRLPPRSVAADIDSGGSSWHRPTTVTHADLVALEERVNLLLAATSREQSAVNARLDEMRQLDLAATLAAAAQIVQRQPRLWRFSRLRRLLGVVGVGRVCPGAARTTRTTHGRCEELYRRASQDAAAVAADAKGNRKKR